MGGVPARAHVCDFFCLPNWTSAGSSVYQMEWISPSILWLSPSEITKQKASSPFFLYDSTNFFPNKGWSFAL